MQLKWGTTHPIFSAIISPPPPSCVSQWKRFFGADKVLLGKVMATMQLEDSSNPGFLAHAWGGYAFYYVHTYIFFH